MERIEYRADKNKEKIDDGERRKNRDLFQLVGKRVEDDRGRERHSRHSLTLQWRDTDARAADIHTHTRTRVHARWKKNQLFDTSVGIYIYIYARVAIHT